MDDIFKARLLLTGNESEICCLWSLFPKHSFESNYMIDNTNGRLTSLTFLFLCIALCITLTLGMFVHVVCKKETLQMKLNEETQGLRRNRFEKQV